MSNENTRSTSVVRSVELFAGAGGMALGASLAGVDESILIERDARACETLVLNARRNAVASGWMIHQGDVADYLHDLRPLRHWADLVCGGPPCQPFSFGGKHQGADDDRDGFPLAIEAVRLVEPTVFVFENVRGLLRKRFRPYFDYIVSRLRHPNHRPMPGESLESHAQRILADEANGVEGPYDVEHHLVNAADYGVPQHRWRVFTIGVRRGAGIAYNFPAPTHSGKAVLRREPWRTVGDAISGLPELGDGHGSGLMADHYLVPGAKSYPGHTGSPIDEPSKSIKAEGGGGENMIRYPNGSLRYMSPREMARCQTFPDSWSFVGSRTDIVRQIGNAVPVALATVILRPLVEQIVAAKASQTPRRLSA